MNFLMKSGWHLNALAAATGVYLLWSLMLACPVMAGTPLVSDPQLDLTLIAPESSTQSPVQAGSSVEIRVMLTNPGDTDLPIPGILELDLEGEGKQSFQVTALVVGSDADRVRAQGFLPVSYVFEMPVQLSGLVRIRPGLLNGNTVMVFAGPNRETEEKTVDAPPSPMTALLPKFQPFFVNFYPYKPVYFLFGADPGIQNTAFQISVKYKPFNYEDKGSDGFFDNPVNKIYLAYTQQSFWDLKSDSAPFEDSRYMPEIFYYDDDLGLRLPWLMASGLQAGFQHESNGRAGNDSRSTNYGYIQPSLVFKFSSSLHLLFAPKAWVYVRNDNETNGDLADYRGYFDLETKVGDPDGLALANHFRHGRKGANWQFDLSYPLNQIPGFKGFLDVYLHAQYYSGYSEQLLQYNQKEDVFRLGFSLVR